MKWIKRIINYAFTIAISTPTPDGRLSFWRVSRVSGVGSLMRRRRLWRRISNCSRAFLFTKVDRFTVNFSILVGSGIGHTVCEPVSFAALTIFFTASSTTRCSKALIEIFNVSFRVLLVSFFEEASSCGRDFFFEVVATFFTFTSSLAIND